MGTKSANTVARIDTLTNLTGRFLKRRWHVFLAGLLILSALPNSGFADSNKKFYIGAGGGAIFYDGGSVISYGGSLGKRAETFGFGLFVITGKDGGSRLTHMGGQIDIWATKGNGLYFGPRVARTSISGGLTLSWFSYGGGLGINIPLGQTMSFGVDGSYLTGKVLNSTSNYMTAMAMFKIWN